MNDKKPATPASRPKYHAGHQVFDLGSGQLVAVTPRIDGRVEVAVRRHRTEATATAVLTADEVREIAHAFADVADALEEAKA